MAFESGQESQATRSLTDRLISVEHTGRSLNALVHEIVQFSAMVKLCKFC